MSSAARSAAPEATEGVSAKFLHFAIAVLFVLTRLVSELAHLRRNPRSWVVFRLALGLLGPALVLLPLGFEYAWLFSIAGVAMFLAAFLLPPAKPDTRLKDKARELGALIFVNGGSYKPSHGRPIAARLFVGADHIWALDAAFRPMLVIPAVEICSVRALPVENGWCLRVEWADSAPRGAARAAKFSYRGFFAEHLARVAESTIKSVLRARRPAPQPELREPESGVPARRGKAAGA